MPFWVPRQLPRARAHFSRTSVRNLPKFAHAPLPSPGLATRPNPRAGGGAGPCNLRVFGSVATGLDREGSDLDLLVDLAIGTSLLHIVGLQFDIEDALGMKVDLCTERELHPALKDRILAEARPL
jgi:uncharacterized protein